jgi:drug/metabolite transporter (DMT)-like permease
LAVVIGIAAVSSSGPLIALAAAPGLAIAFWRNALSTGALAPISLTARRHELRGGRTPLMAGLALAVHFGTWVPSVKLTTVAVATALACVQPIWTGLFAAVTGRRLHVLTWLGIVTAVGGAVITIGPDLRHGGGALVGDVLAVIGGIGGAAYALLGERARQKLTTTSYTFVCYGVCAAALLVVCVLFGVPLIGYSTGTWAAILALTVGAQLLGHSMFNYAVQMIPATTITVLILLEVPGAGLLGWLLLDQTLQPVAIAGIAVLIVGVVIVVLSPDARTVRHPPQASVP